MSIVRRLLSARLGITISIGAVILILLTASGAWASVVLYHFVGTVSDPLGRPLGAATVSDRSQSTATAANGSYSLGEGSTGTFTLTASKAGSVSLSKTANVVVPVDTTINFTLLYAISGSLSQPNISTANGPAASVLTITSWAPQAGSCVNVTDSRTNTSSPATYVSTNPDGSSVWNYTLGLAQSTTEGTYRLSSVAVDCGSGATLSSVAATTYVVDNTAPFIDPLSLVPTDGGNTIFGNSTSGLQPLLARVTDSGGSGVNPSSIQFTLIDDSSAPSTSTSYAATYNATTGWAKTLPVGLVTGHIYSLAIAASDYATNQATYTQGSPSTASRIPGDPSGGGGFLATTFSPSGTMASIPPTGCTLSQGQTVATKTATCTSVPLNFAATSVALGGNRAGPEAGFVEQTVSLQAASLSTSGTPGSIQPYAITNGAPEWGPKTKSMRYDVPDAGGARTVGVPALNSTITQTMTVQVPATWNDATLQMGPTATTTSQAYCADPSLSVGAVACGPDPVNHRYWVVLGSSVSDPSGTASQEASSVGGQVIAVYPGSPSTYVAYLPAPGAAAIDAMPNVQFVKLESSLLPGFGLVHAMGDGSSQSCDLQMTMKFHGVRDQNGLVHGEFDNWTAQTNCNFSMRRVQVTSAFLELSYYPVDGDHLGVSDHYGDSWAAAGDFNWPCSPCNGFWSVYSEHRLDLRTDQGLWSRPTPPECQATYYSVGAYDEAYCKEDWSRFGPGQGYMTL